MQAKDRQYQYFAIPSHYSERAGFQGNFMRPIFLRAIGFDLSSDRGRAKSGCKKAKVRQSRVHHPIGCSLVQHEVDARYAERSVGDVPGANIGACCPKGWIWPKAA
jgi:hypothetical protein